MSYTKLKKEIEKYYKQNGMSFYYNALTTTKEEQESHLKRYDEIRDIVVKKWIEEKRYKELISCAHGGWFTYEEFTKPLEEYFVKENLVSYLKFLCEREIRFKIENTITCLKELEEDDPKITNDIIIKYDKDLYCDVSRFYSFESTVKYRRKTLDLLDKYILILMKTKEKDYLKIIENIREKVYNLSIKKADLKYIKHKI